ncbi:hypothetical protein QR685DRAFT_594518 [Neurospora intermedia]|uniref:Secreted protein n=1 Tax=Neurospora intermedia TaxID=5142 RepID=A0ABR3DUV4_NEUIN
MRLLALVSLWGSRGEGGCFTTTHFFPIFAFFVLFPPGHATWFGWTSFETLDFAGSPQPVHPIMSHCLGWHKRKSICYDLGVFTSSGDEKHNNRVKL